LHETNYPTGKRVRQCLARMFSQAIDSGYLGEPKPQNPFTWESMKHVLPKQKHVHETTPRPAVPFEEIREFMQMLRAYRPLKGRPRLDGIQHRAERPVSALWLEFVVLSGVRIGEAGQATWSEMEGLDGPKPIWRVPAEHHKLGRGDHIIPITKPMLDVLVEMYRRNGAEESKLVFSGPNSGPKNPMSRVNMQALLRRLKWKEHITAHGFRSTFTGWAVKEQWQYELISRQCGRIPHGEVFERYFREPMVEERRAMMEAWGRYCSLPPAEAGQVLPMHRRKTAT